MEVPFRLVRRETPARADAYLLFAGGYGPLAAAVARLDRPPAVYPVRGGFVVVPTDGGKPLPGAVRLRRLAGDLLVPADADLIPALLPDEAVGLTRGRGLVFLPAGEVLAFDPARPLAPADWLRAAVRRDGWTPFPPRPASVDRLTAIERPAPPMALEVLTGGRPDGAEPLPGKGEASAGVPDDARPPAGSLVARAAGGAGMAVGQSLAWLGKQLGAPGLARLGAGLVGRALEAVPRLTEKLLGAQEAALRGVLKQLRDGDIEEALRRAPVAVPDPDAPAPPVHGGADLGTRDPRYSLRDLLGMGGGRAVGWVGGGDVWLQLANEYRRLAALAASRGDHRRAAYIYGVLLRDSRAAANALMAGGLFRDAGVLFRDRLKDDPAAAAAFDRAGDYDEAVRLYDRAERWASSGDLLKRIGEDDEALDRYTRAADGHAKHGRWVAAGDVLRVKAGRPDLAADYFRRGWDADGTDGVAAGLRLLDEYLVAADWPAADKLLAAAEARFRPPRAADAGRFFHPARDIGQLFLPPDRRADLADRCRLLFARHQKAEGRPGGPAEELFGRPGAWPAPVARDAVYATRPPVRRTRRPTASSPPVRLADGTVTAVAVARDTGDIVIATTAAVVVWQAADGRVVPVCRNGGRVVVGLATDPAGAVVYLLREAGDGLLVRCFAHRPGGFEPAGQARLDGDGPTAGGWHLHPDAGHDGEPRVTLDGPDRRLRLRGTYLQPDPVPPPDPASRAAYLLAPAGDGWSWEWDDLFLRCVPPPDGQGRVVRWVVPWEPGRPAGSAVAARRVDWLSAAPWVLEVAGLTRAGVAYWSEFDGRRPDAPVTRTASKTHPDKFRAACLVGPGRVAAVTGSNEVQWLRVGRGGFEPWAAPTKLDALVRVAALVPRPAAGELAAILEDGTAVVLTRP